MPEEINLDNEKIGLYASNVYGFSRKENSDVENFYKKLKSGFVDLLNLQTLDSAKKIIDVNNEISSYCGLPLFEITTIENEQLFSDSIKLMIDIYLKEKSLIKQESSLLKDLNETILNILFLSPDRFFRKILLDVSEEHFKFFQSATSRAIFLVVLSARLSELYLSTKNTDCIIKIVEIFKNLIERIKEADSVISEIADALNFSLKSSKKLIADLISKGNKKVTLDQFKIILTRKFELGQIFHDFVILTSCSSDIIDSELFSQDLILSCLKQMKLYQLLEIAIFLKDKIQQDKYEVISSFIKKEYNLEELNYLDKIKDSLNKYKGVKYGILIREVALLPVFSGNISEGLDFLFQKLNTVSNNLTAYIANKSLSITICLMSKNSIFADFQEEIESKNQEIPAGSNVAKIKDKDIMKKIKESDIAALSIDQMICRNIISIILSMIEVNKENENCSLEHLKNLGFKYYIQNYKILIKKAEYFRIASIILSKIQLSE